MNFKYLSTSGATNVYALPTDLTQQLRVKKTILRPKAFGGLPIHEDSIKRNWQSSVEACGEGCPLKLDEKVEVIFSGPLSSHAQKIARLKELVLIAESADGQALLDGFPSNPNSTFTFVAE